MSDVKRPREYAGGTTSAAVAFGMFAVLMAVLCVGSAVGEAREPRVICDPDHCVEDPRTWFARHPDIWALGLGAAIVCVGLVVVPAVVRRRALFR